MIVDDAVTRHAQDCLDQLLETADIYAALGVIERQCGFNEEIEDLRRRCLAMHGVWRARLLAVLDVRDVVVRH